LTNEEHEQRRIDNEIYQWEFRQRDEERRAAYQRKRAAAAEAAKREAAFAEEPREGQAKNA